jgi:hypothetical protein
MATKDGVQQRGLKECGLCGQPFDEQYPTPLNPDRLVLDEEHRRADTPENGRSGAADPAPSFATASIGPSASLTIMSSAHLRETRG